MTDTKDIIKEWIYEELEQQGLEGTADEYNKVVGELPEMVTPKIIREIVVRLFSRGKREITFVVKTEQDEADLFELLYKHNIRFKHVIQQPDTYELEMEDMTRP